MLWTHIIRIILMESYGWFSHISCFLNEWWSVTGFNPLCVELFRGKKTNIYLHFYHILTLRKSSPWKKRICLSYIISTMAADDLVTQGTRVSAVVVLTKCFQKTPTFGVEELTHWGRVTHICVVKLTIIGSDNGLSPGRRQAIIWTNAGILLIGPLGTNFSEILIGIQTFSFKKMHLKMSSVKWRPFCLGLNVLTQLRNIPVATSQPLLWLVYHRGDQISVVDQEPASEHAREASFNWWKSRVVSLIVKKSLFLIFTILLIWLDQLILLSSLLIKEGCCSLYMQNHGNAAVLLPISAINSMRPEQKGRHFVDDIFRCIFFNENHSVVI